MLKSMFIAFSMYSAIRMPNFEWKEKDMKYAFCFFPLIGAAIGSVLFLWRYVAGRFKIGDILFGGVALVIPVLISGGIHLDGFCDTEDALASHQPRERKLEILKDSNIGAFAVIKLGMYYILYFAAATQIQDMKQIFVLMGGFVLSRAMSGFAALTMKKVNQIGTLVTFTEASDKKRVLVTLVVWMMAAGIFMVMADFLAGILGIGAAIACYLYYCYMSKKEFGGITGDLAGWFLQICELSIVIMTAII